ncbi:hypothetical protein AVEN_117661-1 [Araneus ventricosus]|uniref:Uncharacterized protein n=1 Tax=Araneus ventricosus TaxID=182803 RepID=A0A4Y2H2Z0_ARAVE|nr:hypothetical protein AVEN_117661-1 [Araneus ventricosus]
MGRINFTSIVKAVMGEERLRQHAVPSFQLTVTSRSHRCLRGSLCNRGKTTPLLSLYKASAMYGTPVSAECQDGRIPAFSPKYSHENIIYFH